MKKENGSAPKMNFQFLCRLRGSDFLAINTSGKKIMQTNVLLYSEAIYPPKKSPISFVQMA